MKHFFYYAIIVIVACVSTVATHATTKLTPNARLALLQKQVENKSSHQVNAYDAKPTTPGIYIHAGQKIAIP